MNKKAWTEEKPKVPGYYYLAILWDDGEWSVDPVEVVATEAGFYVWEFGIEKDVRLDDLVGVRIMWMGPQKLPCAPLVEVTEIGD